MQRRGFLALAVGTILGLRNAPAALAEPVPVAAIQDAFVSSVVRPTGALVSSGGLCAPLSPIYQIPVFDTRPIREALPAFNAHRRVDVINSRKGRA